MSAPTKAEQLEEFINTINIPLWEVLEVAMANMIEQSESKEEAIDIEVEAEIDAVQVLIHLAVFDSRLGTEQWRKLAAFCVHYARSRTAAAIAARA